MSARDPGARADRTHRVLFLCMGSKRERQQFHAFAGGGYPFGYPAFQ